MKNEEYDCEYSKHECACVFDSMLYQGTLLALYSFQHCTAAVLPCVVSVTGHCTTAVLPCLVSVKGHCTTAILLC